MFGRLMVMLQHDKSCCIDSYDSFNLANSMPDFTVLWLCRFCMRALKALVSIAIVWPNEIAKEGEVIEISKVILQADPSIPHTLWESAASVLASILQFSSEFYLEIPVAILVRLPQSGSETTVSSGLRALLVLESAAADGTSRVNAVVRVDG
ncbi:Interactor with COP9 signalosome (CSN) complex [Lathyrus oleraceus]|uniref:Interactor with COP9 signalosome (CSN) complex n=1 Tax=Pisum sativum TaxID=3888 RepID=A0A9D4VZZ9_PEA|nr:Interactor with COP9 signalosome (CSN) complex [Pisum sativum]